MDRQEIRELHRRLNTILHQFAAENKVVYIPGSGRYDSSHVTFKVELHFPTTSTATAPVAPVSNAADLNRAIWLKHATLCGCDPDWFGKTFKSRGREFRVAGIRPNRPKNCVYCERTRDGKGFIFTPSSVRWLLEVSAPKPAPKPAAPTPQKPPTGSIFSLAQNVEA